MNGWARVRYPLCARSARFALLLLVSTVRADGPDFVREVRPILEARCLSCHGPAKQKGGLRLDRKADALRGGDTGAVVIAHDPEGSLLIERVSAADRSERMPPEGDPLSAEQIAVLRAWVVGGAEWPESAAGLADDTHWAFRPLTRPTPPSGVSGAGRNPIDAFLASALARGGLTPSPEADRHTLLRRLWLDLLGLPPAPEVVEAILADPAPDAYERSVDRLLASPHFGERMARHWLDVVRFAESHGFEMNQARPNAWPYRDWVIASFNSDRPYDAFVQMQLAGDVLGAGEATGFLVGGPWDQVKSPDPVLTAQQRADELHDMVSTTGSAFLGLTVGCARCHNHKFDPIPQSDYYALKAALSGVRHGDRPLAGPDTAARQARAESIRAELGPILESLEIYEPLARPGRDVVLAPDDPTSTTRLVELQGPAPLKPGNGRGEASDPGDEQRPPTLSRGYLYIETAARDVMTWNPGLSGRFRIGTSWGCGWHTHATDARYLLDHDGDLATTADQVLLATVDQQRFNDGTSGPVPDAPLWSGFRDLGVHDLAPATRLLLRSGERQAFVSADLVRFERTDEPASASPSWPRRPVQAGTNIDRFPPIDAQFVRFAIDATNQAEPCLDEVEVFTAGPNSRNVALASAGAKATASSTLPGFEIHRLEHINDGRYGNERSWISNEPGRGIVTIELAAPAVIDRVVWSRDRSQPPRFQDRLATRYRIEVSNDGQTWFEVVRSADRVPYRSVDDLLNSSDAFASAGSESARKELAQLRTRSQALARELAELSRQPSVYAGQFEAPGVTRRMHRGDPMQEREEVAPGAIAALGTPLGLDAVASDAERRLALGRWITGPAAPLAARVIVNRLWQSHFGTGLVDTPSDFGHNGGTPSHPELLDWLASELVDNGWSLKTIHRLIVTSAAYRQASVRRSDLAERDGSDRLLGRFPPQRLEAEVVRDAILRVSGALDTRMGGPGFDLFEPNANYVKVYKPRRAFGPAEFRRMVYQQKPRMQLDDTFGPFDCPDAGQIAPKRHRSITPQQALSLLNSPFVLDQAERLAARVRAERGTADGPQIDGVFQLVLQRSPGPAEHEAAETLVTQHGLTTLCRALLNANEFLFLE